MPSCPVRFEPSPCRPRSALYSGLKRKCTSVLWRSLDSITTSPPLPPSPPDGPPRGTNFSRRKAMQPLPPSPAFTRIFASSINMNTQDSPQRAQRITKDHEDSRRKRPSVCRISPSCTFVSFVVGFFVAKKQSAPPQDEAVRKSNFISTCCRRVTWLSLGYFYWFDEHELPRAALVHKLDAPSYFREQGVVLAPPDIQARLDGGAALPHDDRTARHYLTAESLHPQPLCIRIATVSRTA